MQLNVPVHGKKWSPCLSLSGIIMPMNENNVHVKQKQKMIPDLTEHVGRWAGLVLNNGLEG